MGQLLIPFIYVLAFVAVVMLIQSVASLVFSAGDQVRRVNRRLTMLQRGMKPEEVYRALVRAPSALRLGNPRLDGLYEQFCRRLKQAGITQEPLQVLAFAALGAGALWLLSLLFLATRA